jgi:hypothetical protein
VKRLHVHITVKDIEESVHVYSTLLAAAPTVQASDYAKWKLEDPRISIAISRSGPLTGIDHLYSQVDSADELMEMRERLSATKAGIRNQAGAKCCYAH